MAKQIDWSKASTSSTNNKLAKTKFSVNEAENSCWNRCKYFLETEDSFYVQLFLDNFKAGSSRLFLDKSHNVSFNDFYFCIL